ncbi:MAG: hypothetical protein PHD11_00885 [Bacteroidales bacterium]|nr:hypothetical protein [Bacteroidales bacterium]MDD4670965.1 hypothetical protein [Bacteroidales bacterium]
MKKITIILLSAFIGLLNLHAQNEYKTVERTYISTDKDVYVAGDAIWCSAYCLDLSDNSRFSKFSSIAYLELHSAKEMVATSKIALIKGRGAGKFLIPATLPTGNYKLIAYTAHNKNEVDYDYTAIGAKTISVFNTLTKERVDAGVKIVDEKEYSLLSDNVGHSDNTDNLSVVLPRNIEYSKSSSIPITLKNMAEDLASVSVSVYHDDGIASYNTGCVADFVKDISKTGKVKMQDKVIPEYEGEIVYGVIAGPDAAKSAMIADKFAYLSVPGEESDMYVSTISEDGKVSFITNNIYGDKEVVCEIDGLDSTIRCHVELLSPFVNAVVSDIPVLNMSRDMASRLAHRSIAMQIQRRFVSDTLFDFLPIRDNALFGDNESIDYILDDYTRFPLMEEVFIEYMPQMRARKTSDKNTDIQIRMEDNFKNLYFSKESSLMMIDGVPIFDHADILKYDPLLVQCIKIYPYNYFVGKKQFGGIANFVTYKHNLPSMTFDDNVRIINFQGASYPMAYTCQSIMGSKDYPDYRETIYWHPILNIEGDSSIEIDCVTPAYSGNFIIVVEGITSKGEAVYTRSSFIVK